MPLCRKSLPICLIHPAPACFPKAKSRNLNHLVLIPLYLARATRETALPREAPATRAPGNRHPIPSGVDEVPAAGADAE
jgi:hypothetical protein